MLSNALHCLWVHTAKITSVTFILSVRTLTFNVLILKVFMYFMDHEFYLFILKMVNCSFHIYKHTHTQKKRKENNTDKVVTRHCSYSLQFLKCMYFMVLSVSFHFDCGVLSAQTSSSYQWWFLAGCRWRLKDHPLDQCGGLETSASVLWELRQLVLFTWPDNWDEDISSPLSIQDFILLHSQAVYN